MRDYVINSNVNSKWKLCDHKNIQAVFDIFS